MAVSRPPGFYGSHRGSRGDPPGTSGKVRSPCWEGFGEVICLVVCFLLIRTEMTWSKMIRTDRNDMVRNDKDRQKDSNTLDRSERVGGFNYRQRDPD